MVDQGQGSVLAENSPINLCTIVEKSQTYHNQHSLNNDKQSGGSCSVAIHSTGTLTSVNAEGPHGGKSETVSTLITDTKHFGSFKPYDFDVSELEVLMLNVDNIRQAVRYGPNSLDLLNTLEKQKFKSIFPNICIVLFCTLPVTVAEAERSISILARVNNFPRSTMAQD